MRLVYVMCAEMFNNGCGHAGEAENLEVSQSTRLNAHQSQSGTESLADSWRSPGLPSTSEG